MNFPYAPRLDSRVSLTGTYDATTGTTTFTLPFPDDTIDCVVLGNAFGNAAGRYLTPLATSDETEVHISGQFVAGPCILGRKYDFEVELTRPFRRDSEGTAIIDDRLQVETVVAEHRNTGEYSIKASMPNRTDRTRSLDLGDDVLLEEEGELRTFLNGDTKRTQWFLFSESPMPVTVAAVVFEADVSGRTRK